MFRGIYMNLEGGHFSFPKLKVIVTNQTKIILIHYKFDTREVASKEIQKTSSGGGLEILCQLPIDNIK